MRPPLRSVRVLEQANLYARLVSDVEVELGTDLGLVEDTGAYAAYHAARHGAPGLEVHHQVFHASLSEVIILILSIV